MGSVLKEAGIHSVTVQVEKEEYFQHLSGLGANMDKNFYKNFNTVNFDSSTMVKAI